MLVVFCAYFSTLMYLVFINVTWVDFSARTAPYSSLHVVERELSYNVYTFIQLTLVCYCVNLLQLLLMYCYRRYRRGEFSAMFPWLSEAECNQSASFLAIVRRFIADGSPDEVNIR